MAFESFSSAKKHRVYAPIITGLAILLAIFLARPAFGAYSDAQTDLASAQKTLETTQAELAKFQSQQAKIASGSELSAQINKINKPFSELGIMQAIFLNNFTRPNSLSNSSPVVVTNVSLDAGSELPNGIYFAKANVTIAAGNIQSVVDYLTHLTTNSPYAFTLNDINLPIDTLMQGQNQETITVPVTLGIYYYPEKK